MHYTNKGAFLRLLEMLVVVVIILFLSYKAFTVYFKPLSTDKKTQESLARENIDTSDYGTIIESVKEKAEDINRRSLDRERQMEDLL